MEAVIAVFALLFVLLVALGAYATVKAVGAAKRSVDRGISQARRTVEDHTLRARSLAQTGAAGELAQLRLRLRTSMRATQDALDAAAPDDQSVQESIGLFQRLSAHGHELDGELKRLESEPDRTALRERLPELRERTERITQSADALRWAVRDRARRFAGDDLDTLSAQIDVEAGALRHWTTAEPTPAPAQGTPEAQGAGRASASKPRTTAGPWPDAPAADAPAAGQTWPETTEVGPEQEPVTRPAITAPAPRPTYPWQKKPRPESTT
ncbi:hypothetical protein ACFC5X_00090 [Streptomyces sp. NPDC055952]|uniref:hypothetical protein n=1 Tax=Streptomyces sp. NPDC055952 TaxID=3345663 RepID=UPI0035D9D14D